VLVPEAVGALAQIELNVTVRGVVGATPLTSTVTVTLVVPYADNGLVPNAGVETVTVLPAVATGAVPFTAMPIDPVTVVPLICADALNVVAPFAEALAALTLTVAMPDALVKAVPADGVIVISVVSATWKETTALDTGAPFASSKVALTLAGVLVVVKLVVGSINERLRVVAVAAAAAVPPPAVVPATVHHHHRQ